MHHSMPLHAFDDCYILKSPNTFTFTYALYLAQKNKSVAAKTVALY